MTPNEARFSVLAVEDDDEFRESCLRWLQRKGYQAVGASNGAEAMSILESQSFDVGLFDMDMPGMSGIELLQRIDENDHEIDVVMLTGQGSIETAVEAMKMGATDFLTKPCSMADLELHLRLTYDHGRVRRENRQLREIISRSKHRPELIGQSPAMQSVNHMIGRIAAAEDAVLITGESGTGKEVVAESIHAQSPRCDRPMVTINCAALPEMLVESELFGHQKGSFTGATEEKSGLFEVADGGTLFIDEFGELPLTLQPKLLRVLQDGTLRRVGSSVQRRVDVRVIAATNRDLAAEVAANRFRQDLYYRVNVLPVHLPPLRDRGGDIERLINHFMPAKWSIEQNALDAMLRYSWPGNVRELVNVIQRGKVLAIDQRIRVEDLPGELTRSHGPGAPIEENSLNQKLMASGDSLESLDDLTRSHVMSILEQERNNKSRAARRLGIHRRKLYRLLEHWQTGK